MPVPRPGSVPVPAVLTALLRAARAGRRSREPPGGRRLRWLCSGTPPEPLVAAKEPFPVQLEAGKKYAWCSCGHSQRQPWCDGAHKREAPGLSPVRFSPSQDGPALLCGCKRTRSPPYCDGSHRGDEVQAAPETPRA